MCDNITLPEVLIKSHLPSGASNNRTYQTTKRIF